MGDVLKKRLYGETEGAFLEEQASQGDRHEAGSCPYSDEDRTHPLGRHDGHEPGVGTGGASWTLSPLIVLGRHNGVFKVSAGLSLQPRQLIERPSVGFRAEGFHECPLNIPLSDEI